MVCVTITILDVNVTDEKFPIFIIPQTMKNDSSRPAWMWWKTFDPKNGSTDKANERKREKKKEIELGLFLGRWWHKLSNYYLELIIEPFSLIGSLVSHFILFHDRSSLLFFCYIYVYVCVSDPSHWFFFHVLATIINKYHKSKRLEMVIVFIG